VIKASATHELLKAIQAVHKGGAFFSPAVAQEFIGQATQHTGPLSAPRDGQSALTSRETEVWQLVAEGHANKQIADILKLSVKTVEKHRQNLMLKLNLHCIASLTRRAVESGVVESQRVFVLSKPAETPVT
jgi:DNA-binding NarL/FixJ family response regulator